jgi:hypothetical protein
MADVFYSPRLTLVRAQYHIQNFKALVHSFDDKKPWAYIVDRQSQPGKIIHKIKFTHPLPEMLPCILFDAVNNLRAVLDQSGYAAAISAGKISPQKNQFSVRRRCRPTRKQYRRKEGLRACPAGNRVSVSKFRAIRKREWGLPLGSEQAL